MMSTKKIIPSKAKFIFVIVLFIVLAQGIYLISSQRSALNLFSTPGKYKVCDKFQEIGSKQQCWENLIEDTLEREGLDSAFNLVEQLYSSEPIFASDCHGFTHLLGQKAYELFSKNQQFNVSDKVSYCGFGFYHAFMEYLLRNTGNLKQARKLCDDVGKQSNQNELARLSCFHGIGHGLLEDVPNPTLKGDAAAIIEKPLETCVELSKTEVEIYRCASGVFNVLAIYYGNSKSGLVVDKEDPYLICHTQSKKQFKEACYDQMNSFVLSLGQGDLSRAAIFIKSIREDDLARAAMHGLAGAYGQSQVSKIDYDEVVSVCQNLEPKLTPSCIEGFLLGMIEGGKPGSEYIEAIKFCSSEFMEESEKTKCFNNVVWSVSVTNPEKLTDICTSLEQKYQQNCNIAQN